MLLANIIQSAFSPLISLFETVLVFLHDHVVASWGLAIIGLTVIVRAILLPLTMRQFRSMQRMQQLAPEMKAIQAKYKDDKQRQQEELMKFYRENNVNPLASCLPLALQLPVLISLFYALRTNLKIDICGPELINYANKAYNKANGTHGQHFTSAKQVLASKYGTTSCAQATAGTPSAHVARFLFIPDITDHATGIVLVVLMALYIGSQLATSLLISASADPNQRRLMIILPLVFAVILIRFPAGLLLYWITTNIWTLGQQYYVRRKMGMLPKRGGGGSGGADGPGGGGGKQPDGPVGKGPAATANGDAPTDGRRRRAPALAGVAAAGSATSATPERTPPPPPRKKKKRSGRRR